MPRRARRLTNANADSDGHYQALRPETPVTVIGGHLSSGKTTLMRHLLLGVNGRRLAALVQDPTALQFPQELIAYSNAEITGLTNGNAYCTMTQGLSTALHDLIQHVGAPDHILLETRADENLFATLRYIQEMDLALDGLIVVTDAERLPALATASVYQHHISRQLHQADLILLNKVDRLTPDQLAQTRAWLAGVAPEARWVETVHAAVPVSLLLGAPVSPSPARDAWRDCDVWCFESKHALDRDALRAGLRSLPAGIIRGAGTVYLADEPGVPHALQYIGRRAVFKREINGNASCSQTKIFLSGIRNGVNTQMLETALRGAMPTGYTSLRALSTASGDDNALRA
jgi:G3E family GTPase